MLLRKVVKRSLWLAAIGLAACSSGGGGKKPLEGTGPATGSSALMISGVLDTGGSGLRLIPAGSHSLAGTKLNLSAYAVVCSTATNPPVTAIGTVQSDGSFSLSVPDGLNQPLSCYVTSGGIKVADFLIADAGNQDLNGNATVSNTATFASSVSLGSVSFDTASGEVTVPIAKVAASIASSATVAQVFDPTGTWSMDPVDFALPAGVRGPCTEEEKHHDEDCNGPPQSERIFLKLFSGTRAESRSHFMQVWHMENSSAPENAFTTCGSRIGLSQDLKAKLGLDFSAYGAADGPFDLSGSVADFHDLVTGNEHASVNNLEDGWKMVDLATTRWTMRTGCSSRALTIGGVTYNGWSCGPDDSARYQVHLQGGCVDASNKPIEVKDWGVLSQNADGSGGQVNQGSNTVDANLIHGFTMTGYYGGTQEKAGTLVTCSSSQVITDAEGTPLGTQANPVYFNWNAFERNHPDIPVGTPCSALADGNSPDGEKIMQLQCYAEYYQRSGLPWYSNACIPRVRLNWTQTDPARFAWVDFRPSTLVFMDQFKPFPDGSGGSLLTRVEDYSGVRVNDSWIPCKTIGTGGITMKKVSNTRLLATFQSATVTTDRDIPACAAAFNGTKTTFLFYLNKQQ